MGRNVMKNVTCRKLIGCCTVCAVAILLTGCSLFNKQQETPEKEVVEEEVSVGIQETGNGKMQYTAKDSTLSITLPNNEWKVEKELEVLYSFRSDYADIKITHVIGADAKKILPAYKEEDVRKRIESNKAADISTEEQTQESTQIEEFTLEDYKCNIIEAVAYYSYHLEYENNPGKVSEIVLGIQGPKEIYELTATLYQDNVTYRNELSETIDSFLLIKDTKLQNGLSKAKQYQESTTDGSVEVKGFKVVKADYNNDGSKKQGDMYTCVSSVNVRDSGGMNSSVIGALETGEQVKVLSEDGGWYEIDYEGQSGFVYKDYLEQ